MVYGEANKDIFVAISMLVIEWLVFFHLYITFYFSSLLRMPIQTCNQIFLQWSNSNNLDMVCTRKEIRTLPWTGTCRKIWFIWFGDVTLQQHLAFSDHKRFKEKWEQLIQNNQGLCRKIVQSKYIERIRDVKRCFQKGF